MLVLRWKGTAREVYTQRDIEEGIYGYVHFVEFMNCVAEFLLYVADAARERRVG